MGCKPYSLNQLKFTLQYSGLMPKNWIANELGFKSGLVIKHKLSQLGLTAKNLQGLNIGRFKLAFDERPEFYLQTGIGPRGNKKVQIQANSKIVPWVWLREQIILNRIHASDDFKLFIHARAMFQEWIFEGNALEKMKAICAEVQTPNRHFHKGIRKEFPKRFIKYLGKISDRELAKLSGYSRYTILQVRRIHGIASNQKRLHDKN